MNDRLTFFRNRRQDLGKEWRVTIELPEGRRFLLFYAKDYLDESLYVETLAAAEQETYADYKHRLRDGIQRGGGGLWAEEKSVDGRWLLKLRKFSPAGTEHYEPPQAVFYTEPGGELCEHRFAEDESSLPLPPDTHVIVPVDAQAERHFRDFREHYASWFPADFESSLLALLRRPSLELRLERLERIISAAAGEGRFPTRASAHPPLSTASWLGYGLVGIIFLFSLVYPHFGNEEASAVAPLVLGRLPLPSVRAAKPAAEKPAPASPVVEAAPSPSAANPPPTEAAAPSLPPPDAAQAEASSPGGEPEPLDEEWPKAARALLSAVKSKSSADSALLKIHTLYFKRLGSKPLSADNAAALLDDKTFLWGLLKLHAVVAAIESKLTLSSDKFLDLAEPWTASLQAYQEIYGNREALLKVDAALACWLSGLAGQAEASGALQTKLDQLFNLSVGCPAPMPAQASGQLGKLTAKLGKLAPRPPLKPQTKP